MSKNKNAVLQYPNHLNELERTVSTAAKLSHVDHFEVEEGRKYLKVIKVTQWQRSVHSFINKETGDLYKPAGWKAPVVDPRGNIYTGLADVLQRADIYGSYLYKHSN